MILHFDVNSVAMAPFARQTKEKGKKPVNKQKKKSFARQIEIKTNDTHLATSKNVAIGL